MKPQTKTSRQVPDPRLDDPTTEWIDKQIVMQRYFISASTLQRWRRKGLITPSTIGRKIYYRDSDIRALLNKNARPKFPLMIQPERATEKLQSTEYDSNTIVTTSVKRPWYKRHRYYSEWLVVFIIFMIWLCIPEQLNSALLLKNSARYGLAGVIVLRIVWELIREKIMSSDTEPGNAFDNANQPK